MSTCASRKSPPSVRTLAWELWLGSETSYFKCTWHLCLLGLVAGVLPWRSDCPTKGWKADGCPVDRQRFQSRGQRTAVPRWGEGCEFPQLHAPGGTLCAASGEESGQGHAWERRPGEAGVPGIRVQGFTQLRSCRSDQDPAKERPLTPYFIVSEARGPEVSKVRPVFFNEDSESVLSSGGVRISEPRELVIRVSGWLFALRTASAEAGFNRFCCTCSHGCCVV